MGIHVHRTINGIHLNQAKYIVDCIHQANMIGTKLYAAPCISRKKLTKFDGDPLLDPSIYRHIIGALQYCTLTRPKISYSVNQLCQFIHCSTIVHLTAPKRVLHYFKGTVDYGLFFSSRSLRLQDYCDSD